jgi:hypothetical protein
MNFRPLIPLTPFSPRVLGEKGEWLLKGKPRQTAPDGS